MSDEIFVCKESFATDYNGEAIVISKGQRVRGGHELINKFPDKFEAADEGQILEIETATKAPGKNRGTADGDKVADGPTRDELRAELEKRGVKFSKRAGVAKLKELLDEAEKATPSDPQPDEGQQPEPEPQTAEQTTETPSTADGDKVVGDSAEGNNPED